MIFRGLGDDKDKKEKNGVGVANVARKLGEKPGEWMSEKRNEKKKKHVNKETDQLCQMLLRGQAH